MLLDMTMPPMGGEEGFREIRRIREDARVILSGGYEEQDATNRFAGKRLAGFIQKPCRANALVAKAREALAPR
ncbi:MAG: response regulator [Deferrisomatales bacterium]|nr:response regulator [Deferrisomatales bacterium]